MRRTVAKTAPGLGVESRSYIQRPHIPRWLGVGSPVLLCSSFCGSTQWMRHEQCRKCSETLPGAQGWHFRALRASREVQRRPQERCHGRLTCSKVNFKPLAPRKGRNRGDSMAFRSRKRAPVSQDLFGSVVAELEKRSGRDPKEYEPRGVRLHFAGLFGFSHDSIEL